MGISTFVAMFMGLIKAKFLAVQLGPSGVGIYSQATTFVQSVELVCGLGMVYGVTKYVSEMRKDGNVEGIKAIISTSLLLQLASSLFFFILTAVFLSHISRFVFSSTKYSLPLLLISSAIPFTVLLSSVEASILGLERADIFSNARIIYQIAGTVLLVAFVAAMKLWGGFLYIVSNAIMCLIVVYLALMYIMKSEALAPAFNVMKGLKLADFKLYSRRLLSYGVTIIVSSVFSWLAILYVRSLLIRVRGPEANGLYQVVFALVSYYSPFFTNGVWGYLFPKLSSTKNTAHYNYEVNKALRFILLFLTPSIAALFLLKRVMVIMIFSKEFLGSLQLFPMYLLGSFFFMISYILGATFLANKQLKAFFSILPVN